MSHVTTDSIDDATDLPQFDLNEFVRRVLAEDMGSGGDVTSKATIAADARFTATMNCREPITVAGLDIAIAFFKSLDREVRITKQVEDGDQVEAGTVLLSLQGNARAMLAAERSALNTLQHLSGVATVIGSRQFIVAAKRASAAMVAMLVTSPPDPMSSASTRRTNSLRSNCGRSVASSIGSVVTWLKFPCAKAFPAPRLRRSGEQPQTVGAASTFSPLASSHSSPCRSKNSLSPEWNSLPFQRWTVTRMPF